jgi:hypothetical protein
VGRRSYHQYCATARTLDLVGERWTLLLVRELLTGPVRFGDLLANLPGMGTGLLAARLRYSTVRRSARTSSSNWVRRRSATSRPGRAADARAVPAPAAGRAPQPLTGTPFAVRVMATFPRIAREYGQMPCAVSTSAAARS